MSAAWERAFRARAAFEAAAGASRMDAGDLRRWLRSYRAALNAVTSACTTLESSLPSQSPAAPKPDFVAAVDDYVEALRGSTTEPGLPWTVDVAALTAADAGARRTRRSSQSTMRHACWSLKSPRSPAASLAIRS